MGTQHRWSLAVGGAAVGYVTNFIGTLSLSLSLSLSFSLSLSLFGSGLRDQVNGHASAG